MYNQENKNDSENPDISIDIILRKYLTSSNYYHKINMKFIIYEKYNK